MQGVFGFNNRSAPTHVGSIYGPLAGSNIWAQMLAGPSLDQLLPVGRAIQHLGLGLAIGGTVAVPGSQPGNMAYVRMAAWDGQKWGSNYYEVPRGEIGGTDACHMVLSGGSLPTPDPVFRSPAVVPGEISSSATPPQIVYWSSNQVLHAGDQATFAVLVSGTPPLHIFWQHEERLLWGGYSNVMTIPHVWNYDVGHYRAMVANEAGSAYSPSSPSRWSPTANQPPTPSPFPRHR